MGRAQARPRSNLALHSLCAETRQRVYGYIDMDIDMDMEMDMDGHGHRHGCVRCGNILEDHKVFD